MRRAFLVLPLLGACVTSPSVEPTEPVDPYAPTPSETIGRCKEPPPEVEPEPCDEPPPAGEAVLQRTQVDRFMENGPQWFVRQVDMEPARLGDRFVGYRLRRFFDGDARFARVDLKVGDVVLRVNGMPIGRPEQFMKAWGELKVAKELTVEYVRGGLQRELRWEIRDTGALPEEVIADD